MLEIAAAEVEDLPERLAEVSVQGRVDDRVEEAIAVAEPEEDARQGGRYDVGVAQEDPDDGEDEEGQPADREGAHDDAQGRAGLALLGQLEAQALLFVGRAGLAAGAVGVLALAAVVGGAVLGEGGGCGCGGGQEDGLLLGA